MFRPWQRQVDWEVDELEYTSAGIVSAARATHEESFKWFVVHSQTLLAFDQMMDALRHAWPQPESIRLPSQKYHPLLVAIQENHAQQR